MDPSPVGKLHFYCAFIPIYLFVLLFTIVIDYVAGILIDKSEGRKRKLYP